MERLFPRKKQPKISLLIPFSSQDPVRRKSLKWLLEYWSYELPDAEVIIGRSKSKVFCKGEALNDAARRSHGRVLVILDADAYLPGSIIERCTNEILEAEERGYNFWFVPYRRLYRLNKYITDLILFSDPIIPPRLSSPPDPLFVEENNTNNNIAKYGYRYGAMIMMFSRKAYETIGVFDERFVGWGGEDVALVKALDTLYGKYKTTNNDILHLWHPLIGENYKSRMWVGQDKGNVNAELTNKYHGANRNPKRMRQLMNQAYEYYKSKRKYGRY